MSNNFGTDPITWDRTPEGHIIYNGCCTECGKDIPGLADIYHSENCDYDAIPKCSTCNMPLCEKCAKYQHPAPCNFFSCGDCSAQQPDVISEIYNTDLCYKYCTCICIKCKKERAYACNTECESCYYNYQDSYSIAHWVLDDLCKLYEKYGSMIYKNQTTYMEHALQSAMFAEHDKQKPIIILAALLKNTNELAQKVISIEESNNNFYIWNTPGTNRDEKYLEYCHTPPELNDLINSKIIRKYNSKVRVQYKSKVHGSQLKPWTHYKEMLEKYLIKYFVGEEESYENK